MFDIGWDEMLLTAIIAIVVIGPKDLPRALRTAGQWIARIRRVSGHFRTGIETMIREAELEEMEKAWREKNDAIMSAHPPGSASAEAALVGPDPGAAPLMTPLPAPAEAEAAAPELPLPAPKAD
ncbi:Sec-independent protein translocase protein TatB [Novosphingobium aquiterrae]|uniref:Sec-independent protein translocase protein TatB n=1 Tax=Novosphingobium aquiterrae TaxID=624388 RepID=A0ABV6PFW1_9SPHN